MAQRLESMVNWVKALVFFLALAGGAKADEVRLALLIGNQDYPANIGALSNTHSDVRILGNALDEVGFEIETGFDLDKDGMSAALDEFERSIATEKADGNDVVAFFYYSGHGTALYEDKEAKNFLLPARMTVDQLGQIYRKAIALEEVLGSLSSSGADMVFVVSDACRDELNLSSSKFIGDKGLVAHAPDNCCPCVHKLDGNTEDGDQQASLFFDVPCEASSKNRHIDSHGLTPIHVQLEICEIRYAERNDKCQNSIAS